MKAYALIVALVLGFGGAWWYGESRESKGYERGYTSATQEQQAAVVKWQRQQRKEYEKELAKEREHSATLQSDLSTVQSDFDALRSEVSNVSGIKPKSDVPGVPDCTGYNPFSDDVARVWNLGASGAIGAAKAAAGSGDGEVSR